MSDVEPSEGASVLCPECGSDNPEGADACMACGADLAAAGGPLAKIPAPVLFGVVALILVGIVGAVGKTLYTKSRPGSLTQAGMAALGNEDYDAAAKAFKEALTYDRRYTPAMVGMARVGAGKKDADLVKRYAKEAIKESEPGPIRAEIRVAYAWALLADGNAREANNQAIDAESDDVGVKGIDAIRGLAALKIDPPQEDDAITFLTKAANAGSERLEVYVELARLHLPRSNFEDGRAAAKKAVDMSPDDVELWLLYGQHLEGAKDLAGYRKALEKALEVDPKSALAHSRLSEIYLSEGNLDKALEHAQQAAQLDAENFEARLAVGKILLAYERPHNARKELEKARALNDTWEVRFLLGRAEVLTAAGSSGYRNMQEALKKAPAERAPQLWVEAATVALEKGLYRDVRSDLEAQIKKHPSSYDLRLLLARSYLGDDRAARHRDVVVAHLEKAIGIEPSRREAPLLLGKFYEKAGEPKPAIEAYDMGLKMDSRDKELLFRKGCAAIEAKLWDVAVQALKTLVDIDSSYPEAKVKLDEANEGAFFSKNQ